MKDKIYNRLAWLFPTRLVYHCAIRLVAYATTGEFSNQDVAELSAIEALKRWEGPSNGS